MNRWKRDSKWIIKFTMGNIKIYYFIVLMLDVAVVFCSSEDENHCCPGDNYVVRHTTTSCYDPELNVTMPMNLKCANNSTYVLAKTLINYEVNKNGQLLLHFNNYDSEAENGTYCLATLMKLKNQSMQKTPVAVLCGGDEELTEVLGEEPTGYCMIVSCLFLFLTAIIYIAFPVLRDLQGVSIINLCVSLGLGFSILAAMKLLSYSDMTLCAVRGFLAYFFILAAFFWMNVISIQVMLTIRRPSVTSFRWKEVIWYAAYAWAVPTILTVVVAIVNFMPGDHIKPGIGLNTCWFFSRTQQWQYMYSVMTILIVVNIGIFVHTSILLWKHTFKSKQYKIVRYRFAMTLRLAIVMGVPWIFEMLGTISPHIIWEILDLINALQGVFIFVVVVALRRRALQAMLQRGWLRCVEGPVERHLARGDNVEDEAEHNTIAVPLESVRE